MKVHLAEMWMIGQMCEVTRKDRINNESIRGNLRVALIQGNKIKECNLDKKQLCTLYGRVINKDPESTTKRKILWIAELM